MSVLPVIVQTPDTEPVRLAQGGGLAVRDMDDLARMASAVAKSGMFKDANTPERAAVKMMFAMAMGFEPITGLTGVDIIDGNPSPNGHFWAAALESHPRYDYVVETTTDQECTIAFYRDGELRGRVTWTVKDATRAGLAGKDNWKKYPRAMLYNRAMTEGGRMFCPQLFGGVRAYVPDELKVASPKDASPGSGDEGQGEDAVAPGGADAPSPTPTTTVPSESTPGVTYTVTHTPDGDRCDCPAFTFSHPPKACKHITAREGEAAA